MSITNSEINIKHKIDKKTDNIIGNTLDGSNNVTDLNEHDNVQLNELFVSIEGEGIFAGTKTLFVRFSGCHLRCYWCDTKYSLSPSSGTRYTIEKAKNLIGGYLQPNIYKVNFTGGEPLLQPIPLIALADFVKNELNIKTYLESSCYDWKRFELVLPYFDICKVEFKTSDSKVIESKYYDDLLQNELKCLELSLNKAPNITFIKIVFTNSTTVSEIKDLATKIFQLSNINNISGITLQPSYQFDSPTNDQILKMYDELCNFYKEVRVIPQMHKLLGMS
jgi:organic radical activating enzyme